jgi:hypothetical protein
MAFHGNALLVLPALLFLMRGILVICFVLSEHGQVASENASLSSSPQVSPPLLLLSSLLSSLFSRPFFLFTL